MNIATFRRLFLIDKKLLERKVLKIEGYLRELKGVKVETLQDYRENFVIKRFIERNLELIIEQIIDICRHLVSRVSSKVPETYSECFEILAEEGLINLENVEVYKRMAKFRNLLIHSYDKVDDEVVYGVYKKHLNDFSIFLQEMKVLLRSDL